MKFRKRQGEGRGILPPWGILDKNVPQFYVSLLGITGVRIWLGCIPYGQQVLGDGGMELLVSNAFRGAIPALIAFALMGRKLSPHVMNLLNIACTVMLVALGELLWFGIEADSLLVVSAAGGAAGWLYIQWGEVYAKLTLPQALLHACVSLAIAPLAVIVLSFSFPSITGFALVVFPLAGCLMYSHALKEFCEGKEQEPAREACFSPLSLRADGKWIISLAVYCVVWGIVQALPFGSAAESQSSYHIVYRVAGAMLVLTPLLWLLWFKKDFNLLVVWYWIIAGSVVGFVMVLVSNGSWAQEALTLFAVGNYSVLMYWWIRCVDFSQRTKYPAYAVFAVGWGILLEFMSLGEMIAQWICGLGNSLVTLVSLGIVLVVVCITVLFHPDKAASCVADSPPRVILNPSEVVFVRNDDLERRIASASDVYRFTKREVEIMTILGSGHTLQFAADDLGISLNTARGHIKRLYAKMDVHSKEEMLDVLQSYEKKAANSTLGK